MCAALQDTGVGDASLAAAACAAVPHRVERENLKDFLAKKREAFLVQVTVHACLGHIAISYDCHARFFSMRLRRAACYGRRWA